MSARDQTPSGKKRPTIRTKRRQQFELKDARTPLTLLTRPIPPKGVTWPAPLTARAWRPPAFETRLPAQALRTSTTSVGREMLPTNRELCRQAEMGAAAAGENFFRERRMGPRKVRKTT